MGHYGRNYIAKDERMTNKQAAIKIIKLLNRSGFQALLAGGCVRDMLLSRPASDYDVATNAQPNDVIKLFRRTLKVGAKFGVVIVLLEDKQVEVATFRTETGYADGRHPSVVKFAGAAEDASRRDFTINGMFYDPLKEKVIDYVNGQADLKKELVRTIGKPKERFSEDYLRMLRAVRFSTQPAFAGRQAEFAVSVLGQLRKKVDFALALTSLFAGCSTEFARERCRILKLSRSQNKHLKFLLTNRGKLLDEKMSLAELKIILAEPYFWDLYELQRAIEKARPNGRKGIAALSRLRRRIKALGDVELRPKPLLNGHDLIRLGAVPGPGLGQLAEEMYIAQLEGKLQTPQQAEQWAQKWLQKHRMVEK